MKTDLLRSRLERGRIIDLLRCQKEERWEEADATVATGSLRSFLLEPKSLVQMLVDFDFAAGVDGASLAPTEKTTVSPVAASETGFHCKNLMGSSVCWALSLFGLLFLLPFLVLRDMRGYRKMLAFNVSGSLTLCMQTGN